MLPKVVAIVAFLTVHAAAHGLVTKITANGRTYDGYKPEYQYRKEKPAVVGWTAPKTQDTGPIQSDKVDSPDIICHREASPGNVSAEVEAGTKIKLSWTNWPDSHHGPVMDYLAECTNGDCSTVDKMQLKFFKIDGVGMTDAKSQPPKFASDDMIKAGNTWEVTIPASIKAGNYVLRHETIALHEAQRVGGAQLYPQCVNIKVTGSGTVSPPGVLGTQLYKKDEPGVVFNIYRKFNGTSDYPVPGPPVFI